MTKDEKKKKDIKIIIISVAIILFSIILASFIPDDGLLTNTPETIDVNDIGDQTELHIQAQQFILQGLVSPSTAKFPALPSNISTDDKGLYQVISYVDSQNGFGAMIRSDWSVTMRLINGEWISEKIIIGGKVISIYTAENCIHDLAIRNANAIKKDMDTGVPFSETKEANRLAEYEKQKSECYKNYK